MRFQRIILANFSQPTVYGLLLIVILAQNEQHDEQINPRSGEKTAPENGIIPELDHRPHQGQDDAQDTDPKTPEKGMLRIDKHGFFLGDPWLWRHRHCRPDPFKLPARAGFHPEAYPANEATRRPMSAQLRSPRP